MAYKSCRDRSGTHSEGGIVIEVVELYTKKSLSASLFIYFSFSLYELVKVNKIINLSNH